MKKLSFFFCVLLFAVACSYSSHLKTYKFSNGWEKNEIVTFDFKVPEGKTNYNLFLLLRHNNNYSFSNIFLITELKLANGSILGDTLDFGFRFRALLRMDQVLFESPWAELI